MVVTSEGVLSALTKTSVAVTAFDAGELESMGVSDVSDVAEFTPNLEIRTAGSTAATLFIRGVGLNDLTANATTSVAVYVDDAPRNLPAIQLGQVFDVEGITILKGPQASGAGRNASAGAIKIHTRKPSGELGGYLRTDYGNYNFLDLEGALEVPLIAEELATRMSFRLEKRDGIVTNRCGDLTQAEIDAPGSACGSAFESDIRPGLDKDMNDRFKWATRMHTLYTPPVDGMSWLATVHGSRIDQLGTVGEHLGAVNSLGSPDLLGYQQPEVAAEQNQIFSNYDIPNARECRVRFPGDVAGQAACRDEAAVNQAAARQQLASNLANRPLDREPFEGAYNNPGYERQTAWGAQLTGEWELDAVQLRSVTAFERYDRERLLDFDYSPNVIFEFEIDDDAWQASEDLQLSGELETIPLSWDTGLFFLGEELDYSQYTLARQPGPVEPRFQGYTQTTESLGAYGQFEIDFLEDYTLEAGARYNWERKIFDAEIVLNPDTSASDRCRASLTGEIPECQRTVTVDHPTYTIGLRYRVDDSRSVYMKYSHGWKGPQFNVRAGIQAQAVTDVADPEKIDAYEAGFEGSWWDGRFLLNGSLFWYSYQDYQVFTFTNDANVPPQRVVVNANDAQLWWAELESTIEPLEGLKGVLRFGWLESRFLDFTDSVIRRTQSAGNVRIVTDFNDNPLPNAPRFKLSGSLEYALDLGRIGTITPRWEFTWTDDVNFDPSGGRGSPDTSGEIFMPDHTIGQKAYMLHNLRLTYVPLSGDLELSGWVRNLTNEVYKQLAFDASGAGIVGNLLGDPRTYGISAKFSF
jgi:iron complex outermembrane receptor protein